VKINIDEIVPSMVFFSVSYSPSFLTGIIFNFLYASILSTHWFQFNLARIRSCISVGFFFPTAELRVRCITKGTVQFNQYFLSLCHFDTYIQAICTCNAIGFWVLICIAFERESAILPVSKKIKRYRTQNWSFREETLTDIKHKFHLQRLEACRLKNNLKEQM
jgi:hypothetical protein